jgi:hypothetical protein
MPCAHFLRCIWIFATLDFHADEFLTGLTPFEADSENPMDTYEKIMKGKYIAYAETAQAEDLIAGLLCVWPSCCPHLKI